MADSYTIESILAADCGLTTTRVFLIDLVDGQHRFVARGEAPSSVAEPYNDIVAGVIQAIRQLEAATGRQLLDDVDKLIRPERADGLGVDAFVATVSAAPPLRVLLAGLIPELSLASAQRAVSQVDALVEGILLLGADAHPAQQVDLIRKVQPDVVVMVGGVEGGATAAIGTLTDVVTLAGKLLEREKRPELVFAGNIEARPLIAEKSSGVINFHPADNVRPSLDVEHLGPLLEELEKLHADRKMARLPGFGKLSAWSPVSVIPGSKSFGQVVRFLAEQYGLNVLGVNLGSGQTILASVIDKNFTLTTGSGWGVGRGAEQVLRDAALPSVARWVLAEEATQTDIANAALTKALYPQSVALTPLELETEQAIAREALRLTAQRAAPLWNNGNYCPYPELAPLWDLIVISGGFLPNQPTLGQGVLAVLDALQPIGVCTLAMDKLGMMDVLGVVGAVQPMAAAQALEHDGLVTLGTLISPVGTGREGETVLSARLTYPNKEVLNLEIAYGSIEVIPLAPGQKATVELRPARAFDIGWGHKGRGAVAEVDGGILGLVIDARGRPLQIPENDVDRRRHLQKWRWDMGC